MEEQQKGGERERKRGGESAFLPSSHSKPVCHVFFFAALYPRLTLHLLGLWGGGVVIQPGEKEGSADESRGGRCRRKRSGFLLIVALSHYRSRGLAVQRLAGGGKTHHKFEIASGAGSREAQRQHCLHATLYLRYVTMAL